MSSPSNESIESPELNAGQVSACARARSGALLNRRAFAASLAGAGTLAATGAFAGCSQNGTVVSVVPNPSVTAPTVVDVLNFALNLEYLEANFYTFVTTGGGLPSGAQGTAPIGTVSGGAKVTFSNSVVASLANQLATDEQEHVNLLRSAIMTLGGTPISMPTINLAPAGTPAVTNDATFLAAARQFETVGISAYAGGAQYLASTVAALNYAAQILDTEAQHEGFLRELCIALGVTSAAVDGQDIPPTATAVFNTNASGLNAVRTTSQVLQILYASPGGIGVMKGGYFPAGLNGNIVSS